MITTPETDLTREELIMGVERLRLSNLVCFWGGGDGFMDAPVEALPTDQNESSQDADAYWQNFASWIREGAQGQ